MSGRGVRLPVFVLFDWDWQKWAAFFCFVWAYGEISQLDGELNFSC